MIRWKIQEMFAHTESSRCGQLLGHGRRSKNCTRARLSLRPRSSLAWLAPTFLFIVHTVTSFSGPRVKGGGFAYEMPCLQTREMFLPLVPPTTKSLFAYGPLHLRVCQHLPVKFHSPNSIAISKRYVSYPVARCFASSRT